MRIFLVVLVSLFLAGSGSGEASEMTRQIIVDGEGRVAATPDMAEVNIGVRREARQAAAAIDAASKAMTSVLEHIAEAGIAPEDIQTTRIGLDPRWQHSQDGAPPRVVGYVASNDLRIRVRELDLLGGLLDAVVSEGANTMNSLSFSVADPAPLEDEARAAAVADARGKARTLASAADVVLGDVISISESRVAGGPMPMATMAMAERATVPVAAGQVEFVVSVRAVFAIAE